MGKRIVRAVSAVAPAESMICMRTRCSGAAILRLTVFTVSHGVSQDPLSSQSHRTWRSATASSASNDIVASNSKSSGQSTFRTRKKAEGGSLAGFGSAPTGCSRSRLQDGPVATTSEERSARPDRNASHLPCRCDIVSSYAARSCQLRATTDNPRERSGTLHLGLEFAGCDSLDVLDAGGWEPCRELESWVRERARGEGGSMAECRRSPTAGAPRELVRNVGFRSAWRPILRAALVRELRILNAPHLGTACSAFL